MEHYVTEIITLIPVLGAIIGIYVNLTTEITKVKSRLISLEADRTELKSMLRECVEGIHDLKIILARKGYDEV